MTTPNPVTPEQRVAELATRMGALLEGDNGLTARMGRIEDNQKALQANALDAKKVTEELERIKAAQEQVIRSIRNNRNGVFIPGLEDENVAKQFSLMRVLSAVKTGDWSRAGFEREIMDQAKTKAQQVSNDTLGGYFVPDQVIADVIGALYAQSVFINLVGGATGGAQTRVRVIDGLVGNVKIPKFDGGCIAYWIGENDAYVESQANTGLVTMNQRKLGVLVALTAEMMRSGAYGFENLLRQDMTTALALEADRAIAYGNGGDHTPRGITRMSGIKVYENHATAPVVHATLAAGKAVADWAGAVLNFDGLDNMQLALEEDKVTLDASFATISCPRFFKQLKQLKVENYSSQTTGQPYLIGMPMLPDARLREIIGDFGRTTQIPSTALPGAGIGGTTTSAVAKHSDVFMGNFSNVLVGRWSGIEIADDGGKGSGFTSDRTYVKVRMYMDVAARQERALIVCPNAQVRA